MAPKNDFENTIKKYKPIFAYNPQGLLDISLIESVQQVGGIGLVNLERLSKNESKDLLNSCFQKLKQLWGVRISTSEQLDLLLSLTVKEYHPIIVIIGDLELSKDYLEKIKSKQYYLLAEVVELKEAYEKKWAEAFVIKGHEAAGRIGDETSFILSQQFADAGLSYIVQGGMGFYTSAAVLAIGAKGIILDTQLYLTPECPLTLEAKDFLSKIDSTDTKILCDSTKKKYRVFSRLGTLSVKNFLQKEQDLLSQSEKKRIEILQKEIFNQRDMFESKDLSNVLLPIGQDIVFAKILTNKFTSVEGIINGLVAQIKNQIDSASKNFPLKENTEVTKKLGIRYPLIQGPMANVSESPDFAKVLSDNGVLPFLALGSLFPNQARTLIIATKEKLGSTPFGCGIIGLEANKKARDNHLAILKEIKPSFAVVAAGTIDQALEVKGYGIETFLHTPSPTIFAEAIESNVSNLVLEGMECGGHIGFLTSFVLWELSLHKLVGLEKIISKRKNKITVAFAGGIGERYSAAMVGVISVALRNLMNSVLWVGTSYLLVKEIVGAGAIQPLYQQLALNANETMVLGETVNTRARAIPTPFAKEIVKRELERIKQGISLNERKHQYERDNLGATRIAALGEIWNPEGEDDKPNRFMPIDEKGQYQKGNYLIGQIVSSLRCIRSVAQLHNELIVNSEKTIVSKASSLLRRFESINKNKTIGIVKKPQQELRDRGSLIGNISDSLLFESEGIAIIGLGCVFPDAPNTEVFWNNILNKINSIREIPKDRWAGKIDLFYDSNKAAPNKTYSKIAATIQDFTFNSLEFKIPPNVVQTMGKAQKIALVAAKEALEDAKLLGEKIDNSKTAVIIGNAMGDEIRVSHTRKIFLPEVLSTIELSPTFQQIKTDDAWKKVKNEVFDDYESRLVPINEDSMPGELSNVIAGRISNVFNLKGKSMTTDAACASSLAALSVAIETLLAKESDVVLCGGVDCSLDPTTFVKFAKIGAISAEGSFPFDKKANGFVMGEGAGFIVLKRLSDAIKDKNKIYAVIRGVGASSDGKGKGITAPNPQGQKLAIQRALDQAQLNFSQIQLIEAHGTSTTVGDVIELEVLNDLAKEQNPQSIAMGSIKSQIGHLKSAAGIASIIKAVKALQTKTLPPSINFDEPNPKIDWEKSPFYVNQDKKVWDQPSAGNRIVGVSSFGFGGTNYHVLLEEYIPGKTKGHLPTLISEQELQKLMLKLQAHEKLGALSEEDYELDQNKWQEYYSKNQALETESIFFGGNSIPQLIETITNTRKNLPKSTFGIDGKGPRVGDLVYQLKSSLNNSLRVSLTCSALDSLPELLDILLEGIKNKDKRKLLMNRGMFFSEDHSLGKIAFLFPGQGSQYIGMGKELWQKYEIVRETFKEADRVTKELIGFPISELIFAKSKSEDEANELLKQTEITQPAIFVVNIAIFRLLNSYGIKPDFVAGHSMGEYAALVASGILSLEDGLRAVIPRGQAMAKFDSKDKGTMASISAGYIEVEKVLKKIDGYVIAANKNTPKQTVISGETTAVLKAMKVFSEMGINAVQLPVSGAFHSNIVKPAINEFRKSLEKLTFNPPDTPISSNVTGELYPKGQEEVIELLCNQICSPVEWIKQIESMYKKYGVRTFIEIGPKYVLTSFTRGILEDKFDILALASNHPKKGAIQHFSEVIGAFGTYGYPLKIPSMDDALYTEEYRFPYIQFYTKSIRKTVPHTQTIYQRSPFDILVTKEIEPLLQEKSFKDYLELQAPAIGAFLKVGFDTYKSTIATAIQEKKLMEKLQLKTESLGVTGVSIGLPGKGRKVFDKTNFDDILAGKNFIDLVPNEIRDKMADKNIIRLVKDAIKGAQFQAINDVTDVIKLAAQKGDFNLVEEYGIDIEIAEILDITFQLAFAAGIEALRDAGIPLMPLKVQTSVGKEITKGWALPESLRDDTGIIFASAFPGYTNLISVVSDYMMDKYSRRNKEDILHLFNELISQISDEKSKAKMKSYFEKNKKMIFTDNEKQFEFSRKFLFEILSMGHSQFAQFIYARGPNTQVNAACSSTTQAIAIAEDWIRTGRCNRVIVIGADDVTNEKMMEWIGSGFLAVGAATTKDNVKEAALPFDRRRHGMIIGMGAVGIVIESASAMKTRGVKPIADLLGTHIVNSAFHGTRLDSNHISNQMNEFITKIEHRFGLNREDIANELVFISHETYTPARGGSASAEVEALRKTFGSKIDQIIIANTKGFTGHAMGAGIEDVVAVKILEKGIVPPVANWKEQDPELGYLNLSKGGKYNVNYALRFAAGFGSQLTLVLYRLNTSQGRFDDEGYEQWLKSLGGSMNTLEIMNKTLLLKEDSSISLPTANQQPKQVENSLTQNNEIVNMIFDIIIDKTGYPRDMIGLDMHLEEDLGIDTVKQAELFGIIRAHYNLPREEGIRIQDYSTVNKIAEYISSKVGSPEISSQIKPIIEKQEAPQKSTMEIPREEIANEIIALLAEKTGYPGDMLEPDMALEEDLGIDTVKQAEMFGIIRTKWNLPREEGIRIQDYSTINKIADYILSRLSSSVIEKDIDTKDRVISSTITGQKKAFLKRQIVQLIDAPKLNVEPLKITNKKFLVIGEKADFSTELLSLFEQKKAKIAAFVEINDLQKSLSSLNQHGSFDGVVFIEPKTTETNKHEYAAKALFMLFKEITLNESSHVLVVSKSDTAFGFNGKASPIIGSLTGFTKALARELPSSYVRVLSCTEPTQVIEEILSGDGSVEVAYSQDGLRKVIITSEAPIQSNGVPIYQPTEKDLILITGGAQGITFEITKELSQKYKPKLALIGRTELPANIHELVKLNDKELDEKKNNYIAKLKGQGVKVTPVQIEKEWSRTIKAISIQKAIEELKTLGSEVRYYSVDVVDSERFSSCVKKVIADFKQDITCVVHAAGVETSKLIPNKKLEDFEQVYRVKAVGFDNLLANINLKALKLVICFSSVAGRYGNAGQVDYSAANDYLSKNCWQLRKKGIRAISICWSAWGEVGMATRGSILQILGMAGVTPISVKDGVQAFINELEYGQEAEVVVSGSLGILLTSPSPYIAVDRKSYPLIGSIKRNFDGSISSSKEFNLETDLYLNHHRFEDIPYLPGVIGLELFTQLAKIANPNTSILRFEDVEFRSAVKFANDESRILKARLLTLTNPPEVVLESEIIKEGVPIQTKKHFSAKIVFGKRTSESIDIPKLHKDSLANKKTIYNILPHGHLFQVLTDIDDISDDVVAKTSTAIKNHFNCETNDFIAHPLAIEAGFQSMGIYDIVKENRLGLPFGIKSLEYYQTTEQPTFIKGMKITENEYGSIYNFAVLTKSGQVVLKVTQYTTALVDFGFNLNTISSLHENRVKRLFKLPTEAIIQVISINELKNMIVKDANFLVSYLHPQELEAYHSFTVEKRKDEWLAGIIAIKKALLEMNSEIQPNKVKIEKTALGKPYVQLSKKEKSLSISITHSNGFVVGVLDSTFNTGIDLEVIEKRDESIIDELLSTSEKELLQNQKQNITNELITKIWTAKEAATKVLGTGLNIDLHDIILNRISDQEITMNIDLKKIPSSEATFKGKTTKDSLLELKAHIKSNNEFVAAVCQLKDKS